MFYYDFYFMGKFVKRFKSYDQARKLVTWNENLTHPDNLYEIKTVQVNETNKKRKGYKMMNIKQIKKEMEQYAIGTKYLADCCGVTEHYLRQCLGGSKPVTKALNKKIDGVLHTLKITPKHLEEELKQPVLNVEPSTLLPVDIEYTDPLLTIKRVCEYLDNTYGNTEIKQFFCIHGNKRVYVNIDIQQKEESK